MSSSSKRNILLYRNGNQVHKAHIQVRLRDVSRSSRYVGLGMQWTQRRQVITSPDENARSGRRSRVVLAPRPWRYVGGKFAADNGGKKGRFPGESTKETVTPLRGESRDVLAVPVVLTRVLFFAHGATGAVGARLSLRPLQERDNAIAQPGRKRAVGMRTCVSTSSRRKCPDRRVCAR